MIDMKQLTKRLRDDELFVTAISAVYLLLIISLLWNLVVPLRAVPSGIDTVISLLPAPVFLLTWVTFGNIAYSTTDRPKKNLRFLLIALCGVLLVPNLFSGILRNIVKNSSLESCEGTVTERYVSHNHGALSIVVTGESSIRMEGINESFYNQVAVGDEIVKEPWSYYALLNGCPRRIVVHKGWWPMSKGIASGPEGSVP
jgi:hypothetical protein